MLKAKDALAYGGGGPPELPTVSQQQFGQSFGGGAHSLEQEVEPQSSQRTQMAGASGATYAQMNMQPHTDHMAAHQPRTDTFNRMQNKPPTAVYAAGGPFDSGQQPEGAGVSGQWAAAAPLLQEGGDARSYDVTQTTDNLIHPQAGIGGSAERDDAMRKKVKPM